MALTIEKKVRIHSLEQEYRAIEEYVLEFESERDCTALLARLNWIQDEIARVAQQD